MVVDVAVGLLCNVDGHILVSQRRQGTHLSGMWEFPGGKFERGEGAQQALLRELGEELNIKVLAAQPMLTLEHHYSEKTVRLHVFDVLRWQGTVSSGEGQALQWVDYDQLCDLEMPAADRPILKALRLPGQYLITPNSPMNDKAGFFQQLEQSLFAGIGIVQLRQPKASNDELVALAATCRPLCINAGARLVVNASPEFLNHCDVDGLHLNSERLRVLCNQSHPVRPVADSMLLGASCHDEAELKMALSLDCDYVLLSPVKPTRSHATTNPLGWSAFRSLAMTSNIPIYALGGMHPQDQDQARANGAIGVAGITGFWAALNFSK